VLGSSIVVPKSLAALLGLSLDRRLGSPSSKKFVSEIFQKCSWILEKILGSIYSENRVEHITVVKSNDKFFVKNLIAIIVTTSKGL